MSESPNKLIRFWQEFKRRNVHRTLTIYIGTAFIILQNADIIFARWGLPDWTFNLIIYLLIVGAIITAIISWIYEITPKGIIKSKPSGSIHKKQDITIKDRRGLTISNIVIAVLILIVGILLYPKIFKDDSSPLSGRAKNTIAVLPLKIIGDASDVKNFASGLVESLTYMLTRVGNSQQSFSVIPTSDISETISTSDARKQLGASIVISGSIQMDKINTRLILNLIDTKKQRLLRSEKIDYQIDNDLILQDEIISVMVKMLGIQLESQTKKQITAGGPVSVQANEFYLLGRGILRNYHSIEDLDAAIEYFKRSIEKDTLFSLAYSGLADANWEMYHETSNLEFANLALLNSKKAISLNDTDASIHISLGIINAGRGESEAALREFQRAIELDPQNERAYIQIGKLYDKQGNIDKAESYFKQAISLKPDYWNCYYALGLSYYFNGQYTDAIDQFNLGLQLASANQTILTTLAACYYQLLRLNDAIQTFERIVQTNPDDFISNANLGTAYFFKGNYDKAIFYYNKSLSKNPNDYQNLGFLGDAYYWSGDKQKSDEVYKTAIESARRNLEFDHNAVQWIACFYGMLGIVDSALYYLDEANIPENPENTDTYMALQIGEIYLTIGEKHKAVEWIESAIRRNYGWVQVKYHPMYKDLIKNPDFQRMIEKYKAPQE
jgi:tetratricopeptide (TPR) repeat protein